MVDYTARKGPVEERRAGRQAANDADVDSTQRRINSGTSEAGVTPNNKVVSDSIQKFLQRESVPWMPSRLKGSAHLRHPKEKVPELAVRR